MKIYFDYETTNFITDHGDPSDEWSRDSTDGTYDVVGVTLTPGFRDALEVTEEIAVGDEVTVVWVQYGDGDTFGSDGGYGAVIACTKNPALAAQAAQWAQATIDNDSYWHGDAQIKEKWPQVLPKPEYPYWLGYFNWGQVVKSNTFTVS